MKEVPIWEKANLTLEEAAAYSGIRVGKLRELTNEKDCNFVLWVGNKRLINKHLFDNFIEQMFPSNIGLIIDLAVFFYGKKSVLRI